MKQYTLRSIIKTASLPLTIVGVISGLIGFLIVGQNFILATLISFSFLFSTLIFGSLIGLYKNRTENHDKYPTIRMDHLCYTITISLFIFLIVAIQVTYIGIIHSLDGLDKSLRSISWPLKILFLK